MTRVVAVTGAGGYLGSRLVSTLAPESTRALVRKAAPFLPPALEQVELDLLTEEARLADALAGVDAVVHLAGPNETFAALDPERALAETSLATQRVIRAASSAGVRRVVYVSSVHVYGAKLVSGAIIDEATVPAPRSTYAIARLASEHLVGQAAEAGLEVVILRLTNAVGAPAALEVDRWSLVASDLARQAVRTGDMVLRSSGQQWRDFIALGDVCAAVRACTGTTIASGTYNLASGSALTVRALAELIADGFAVRTGTRPRLRSARPQADPPGPYTVAVGRLEAAGWEASVGLIDAVDELISFCLNNKGALADE